MSMNLDTLRNQSGKEIATEVEESLLAPAGWYTTVPEWSVLQRETDGDAVLRFYGAAKLTAADSVEGLAADAYTKVYRFGFNVNFTSADTSKGQAVKIRPQLYRAFQQAMGKEPLNIGEELDYIIHQPMDVRVIALPARDAGTGRDGREYGARSASSMVVAIRATR